MNADIASITPPKLHALQAAGDELNIIDVRTPGEYRSGHIEGARLIPLEKLSSDEVRMQLNGSGLGTDPTLYLTCHSGTRALQAAEHLATKEYRNVAVVDGGTQAWEQAGLPIKRCGNMISLERQVQIAVGSLIVLKVIFGFTVHELFFALSAIIGGGLIVAGITRWCGLARLLTRMPWNRGGDCTKEAAA